MKSSKKLVLFFILFASDFAFATIKMAVTIDDLPVHGKLPPVVSRVEIVKSILATLKSNNVPNVYGFINAGHINQDKELTEIVEATKEAGLEAEFSDHIPVPIPFTKAMRIEAQ